MTRQQALDLLHKNMQNQNLRRHCYTVEAVMRALYKRLDGKGTAFAGVMADKWGIAGLLHDADYELTKDSPKDHTHTVVAWLREHNVDDQIISAILAHGYGFVPGNPMPKNSMEWSLYTCDELTGFIIAVALIKGKSLANVTVESILKKFPQKSFAAGVHREQIKLCEEKLGIPLNEFVSIALKAMQEIHQELGL